LLISCTIGFFISILSSPAIGKMDVNDAAPLFMASQQYAAFDKSDDPTIVRKRFANINLNLLETTNDSPENDLKKSTGIKLNLFDDSIFMANFDRVETESLDSYSLIGRIDGEINSSVILVVGHDGTVSGNITILDTFFQVRSAGNGTHVIYEIDQTAFPDESEPIVVKQSSKTSIEDKVGKLDFAPADSGSIIDVLVVYTPAARSAAGGEQEINILIDLAVSESNEGYSNSNIHQRLRLVHKEEVNYSENEFDWEETLERLQDTNDGYMDNVHTLRDTYAADCVVLIVNDLGSCGLAYVMQPLDPSFESHAFALVSRDCATGNYSFAHELGHNMGSQHDHANSSNNSSGAYSYSHGYQAPDQSFRTVMAYPCPGGCDRVNFWSNPNVNYNEQPTGVDQTANNPANNRRSLDNTAYTVANFRASISKKPAITSPAPGSTLSDATQTFCWTDNDEPVTILRLFIGSRKGARDIYSSGDLGTTTCNTVSGLPTDGSTVYVRLYYQEDGPWQYIDETYTASGGSGTPEITSPAPGSTLSGAT